jgi:hypothetical protein
MNFTTCTRRIKFDYNTYSYIDIISIIFKFLLVTTIIFISINQLNGNYYAKSDMNMLKTIERLNQDYGQAFSAYYTCRDCSIPLNDECHQKESNFNLFLIKRSTYAKFLIISRRNFSQNSMLLKVFRLIICSTMFLD